MENSYSLLVVDDELIAREHILTTLDWEKLGIHRLYEADNGFAAEAIIQQSQPDIMLLDVRMPQMTGVELMERILKKSAKIQVIVLSAYSDFEAARKMLSMGMAADYILKPVEEDVLTEAIIKCISNIERTYQDKRLQEDYREAQHMLRRRAVSDLVLGIDKSAADELLPADRMKMQVGVCYVGEHGALPFELGNVPPELAPLKYCFKTGNPNFIALYFEADGVLAHVDSVCRRLALTGHSIGLGRVYSERQDLNLSYHEAMIACEISLFNGRNVNRIEAIDEYTPESSEWTASVARLLDALRTDDDQLLEDILSKLFYSQLHSSASAFRAGQINNLAFLKAQAAGLLEAVFDEGRDHLNLSNLYSAADSYAVYLECRTILLKKREELSGSSAYKEILVKRVKSYISEHYSEQITLNTVAAEFFTNPSYLSRLFSESEGCGFSDYVTALRIKRAKELLRECRSMKIYEVAEAVGYNSPKYFIRVFKEKVGETPAGYRSKLYYL